jgi:hypothetical protein
MMGGVLTCTASFTWWNFYHLSYRQVWPRFGATWLGGLMGLVLKYALRRVLGMVLRASRSY